MFSEDYYMERAMQLLEPLIVNEYQMVCGEPGCGYKSRKRCGGDADRRKVVALGVAHQLKTHHTLTLCNHQIKVDIYQPGQPVLDVELLKLQRAAVPPPF